MAKSAKIRFLILVLMITTLGTAQESGGKIEGVVLLAGSRMPLAQARVVLGTWLSSQPPLSFVTFPRGTISSTSSSDRTPATDISGSRT